jgi:porin
VTFTRVYEAWAQQLFLDDKVSLLVGLHDLNSEFYVTDTSGLFFNSSFGVGKDLSQTAVNGPSIFPNAAAAIRLRVEPTKSFYLETALFNAQAGDPAQPQGTHFRLGANDGQLFITEAAYFRGRSEGQKLYGKYGLGVWSYTRTFDNLAQTVTDSSGNEVPLQSTSRGAYFLGEQAVSELASIFLRYGVASTDTNAVSRCLGTGVVFTGLLPSRDRDRFGLALARSTLGESSGGGAETTYEANYRVELIPGVALQPDLQYIVHPSADITIDNALVGAFRVELSF